MTDEQGKLIALGGVLLEQIETLESAVETMPPGLSPVESTCTFTMADGRSWKVTVEFADFQ